MPIPRPPERQSVSDIAYSVGDHIDAMTTAFQDELEKIIRKAQSRTIAALQKKLDITDGMIQKTANNARVLRKMDNVFVSHMKDAGYTGLVDGFVGEFNEVIPFFQETVNAITDTWKEPPPPIDFTPRDLQLFAHVQTTAAQSLKDIVVAVGTQATTKIGFSIGGMPFENLVLTLSDQFAKTVPQATTLGATMLPTFYRTISETGFQKIEKDLSREKVYYTYEGPDDKLTRPFCSRLIHSKKAYTRAEIGNMDNESLPNAFVTCGGYNCRHQWILWAPKR